MKKFKVFTSFTGGGIYIINAKSKEEAIEKQQAGEFEYYHNDENYTGDSQEEVYDVEEVK